MQVSLISPSFNAYVRAPVRIPWCVLPALGQAETANVADADGDAGELPGGAVNVYINGVLVTSSAEMSQDYVLAADLPEAPTRNDISVVLLHRDSQREVDRVSGIFFRRRNLKSKYAAALVHHHVSANHSRPSPLSYTPSSMLGLADHKPSPPLEFPGDIRKHPSTLKSGARRGGTPWLLRAPTA